MIDTKHLVFLTVVLYVRSSTASPPVYHEDHYEGHHEHHALPPATSYASISTTHVKVQHPPPAPTKYATPYKYEYLTQPQIAYKYISLPSSIALQQHAGAKYEEPSTPGYKYLAASPTYKYVQPPAVTTEPEAAEEPTNPLKYAFKYEQNTFKQEQLQQQQQHEQEPGQEYEHPVQYKYIAVPSYKYAQQVPAAASYDYTDEKQQY